MRIGILTFHRSHNYGAFLQAFALSHSLQKQFPESTVEIIDYDMKASHNIYIERILRTGKFVGTPYYAMQYSMFRKQLSRLPLSQKTLITDDYEQFRDTYKNQYDLIVVGSDQVWVTSGMRGFPNAFWLPGDYGSKKVSYAASSRSEMSRMPLNDQELIHQYLNDFSYIGARDDATIYEINKFLEGEKSAHFNPDPVFTWDFGDVKAKGREILARKFGVKSDEKAIGIMIARKTNAKKIIETVKTLGYTPVALYFRHHGARNAVVDPFEWFSVISGLDGIVTSLFHGMCFSIKYDIPFVAIEERKTTADNSKMFDLLKRIHNQNRYITENDDITEAIMSCIVDNTVDFSISRKELYERFLESIKEMKESII